MTLGIALLLIFILYLIDKHTPGQIFHGSLGVPQNFPRPVPVRA
jgi:hypothetical protein